MERPLKHIKHTFGKDERLTIQRIIAPLFSRGIFIGKYPIKWGYLWVDATILDLNKVKGMEALDLPNYLLDSEIKMQVVMVVSKKKFKKAHDRNRVKRIMREWYRAQKHKIQLRATELYREHISSHTDLKENEGKQIQIFPWLALSMVFAGDQLPDFHKDKPLFQKSLQILIDEMVI